MTPLNMVNVFSEKIVFLFFLARELVWGILNVEGLCC